MAACGPDVGATSMDAAKSLVLGLLGDGQDGAPPFALTQRCSLLSRAWQHLQGHIASAGGTPDGSKDYDTLRAALVQQQYLLAVDLLLHAGARPDDATHATRLADRLLRQLGLRWRLADPVWTAAAAASAKLLTPELATDHASAAAPQLNSSEAPMQCVSGPLALDSALPPATLSALQRAFAPTAPFWANHAYDEPDTPFFSYVSELGKPPTNVVELAAQQLRGSPALRQMLEPATHVEWWVHRRPAPSPGHTTPGHQLHFDCDETRLRQGAAAYSLVHPLYSSVLYLSAPHTTLGPGTGSHSTGDPNTCGHNTCASSPTFILDQVPGQAQLAERGWAVAPRTGRYLVFPGNLLHGVLPGRGGPCMGGDSSTHDNKHESDNTHGDSMHGASMHGDEQHAGADNAHTGRSSSEGHTTHTDAYRITLMLAWWVRGANEQGSHQSPRTGSSGQSVEAAGTGIDTGTGTQLGVQQRLRPWMSTPQPEATHTLTDAQGPQHHSVSSAHTMSATHGVQHESVSASDTHHPPASKRAKVAATHSQPQHTDLCVSTEPDMACTWVDQSHALMLEAQRAQLLTRDHTTVSDSANGSARANREGAVSVACPCVWCPEVITPVWCEVAHATLTDHTTDNMTATKTSGISDSHSSVAACVGDSDIVLCDESGMLALLDSDFLSAVLPDLRFFLPSADLFNQLYPTTVTQP